MFKMFVLICLCQMWLSAAMRRGSEPTDPIAADRRTEGCRESLRTSSTPAYPVAPATPTLTGV